VGLRPEARHPRSSEAARTPVTQPKKVFQSAPILGVTDRNDRLPESVESSHCLNGKF
jgi:hypothetical protein